MAVASPGDLSPVPRRVQTLAIVVGASEWPLYPDFPASPSFRRSAAAIVDYLRAPDGLGLSPRNTRVLIDSFDDLPELLRQIRFFVNERRSELAALGSPATDMIFYYVGHGGFAAGDRFFLSIRATDKHDALATSITAESLGRLLRDVSAGLRVYVVLDCCFAAAATLGFMGSSALSAAEVQLNDALPPQGDSAAIRAGQMPSHGTALLCAAGSRERALAPLEQQYTLFSGELLDVLRRGDGTASAWLSLDDLQRVIAGRLRTRFRDSAVVPEVHVPLQRMGRVDVVPLFRNPAVASQTREADGETDATREETPLQNRELQKRDEPVAQYLDPPLSVPSSRSRNRAYILAGFIALVVVASVLITRQTLRAGAGAEPNAIHTESAAVRRSANVESKLSAPVTSDFAIAPAATAPPQTLPAAASPVDTSTSQPAPSSPRCAANVDSFWLAPKTEGHVSERSLLGHQADVHAVAFSPDGKLLATGSYDETVKVWDVSTGRLRSTCVGPTGNVFTVAFSPDGHTIASAGTDEQIYLWRFESSEAAKILSGHSDQIWSIAFSPDGRELATASQDKTIRLWSLPSGKPLNTMLGSTGIVYDLTFAPDGKTLLSGGEDRAIRAWNVDTGHELPQIADKVQIYSLALSPDGRLLATGGSDKILRLWDVATGHLQHKLVGHSDYIYSTAFSPDGKILASGSRGNEIKFWDVATGQLLASMRVDPTVSEWLAVWSLAFSPDGRTLAAGLSNKAAKLYMARRLLIVHGEPAPEDAPFLYGAVQVLVARPDDPSNVGALLKSRLEQRLAKRAVLSPTGRTLYIGFVEDGARRANHRIFGKWRLQVEGRPRCDFETPERWYGLGGYAPIENAFQAAADDGLKLLGNYLNEKVMAASGGC